MFVMTQCCYDNTVLISVFFTGDVVAMVSCRLSIYNIVSFNDKLLYYTTIMIYKLKSRYYLCIAFFLFYLMTAVTRKEKSSIFIVRIHFYVKLTSRAVLITLICINKLLRLKHISIYKNT